MAPRLGLGGGVTADPASGLFGGIPEATKDFNFAVDRKSDSALDSQDDITFGRGSVGRAMNSSGNIVEVSSGEPRYEYDKDGNSLGLLMEEESTNNITTSDFGSGWNAWESGGLLSGTTTTGPDGVSGSGKGIGTIAGTKYNVTYNYGQLTSTHGNFSTWTEDCFSIYAKKGNVNYLRFSLQIFGSTQVGASFNLDSGSQYDINSTNCSAIIEDVGSGWYRCVIYNVTAMPGSGEGAYAGIWLSPSGSSSSNYVEQRDEGADKYVYLWNAQRDDDQQYPGSPIVTSGGTATRAADSASMQAADLGYNNVGTFFIECKRLYDAPVLDDSGADDHAQYLVLWNAISGKSISIGTTDTKEKVVSAGMGSDSLSIEAGSALTGRYFTSSGASAIKIAVAIAEDDCAASLNGANAITDTSFDIGENDTGVVYIGGTANDSNGWARIHGQIKRIRFWDTRLTDKQLKELSA